METVLICGGTFVLSIFCLFFSKISVWFRSNFEKNVQCWFCHVWSKVKFIESNCWTCASCGQYNGFNKDGDYNREISGQYDAKLNTSVGTYSQCKPEFKRSNALCHRCNYNQELKIKQLASFSPLSEANYEKEIHHFKLQLEESYKLCSKCEQLVASVISSQKYVLPGPRRLVQITKKLVFKSSWSLYLSMVLSVLMITNKGLIGFEVDGGYVKYLGEPVASQVLSGLGVVVHTLQCCQYGTYWSFVNWLVWALMASSPHFLQSQLPSHITYIQMAICSSLLISTLIILVRRKKMERSLRNKEEVRHARRLKENSTAVWNSVTETPVSTTTPNDLNLLRNGKKSNSISPVKLSVSSGETKSGVPKLVKPVPRLPENQPDDDLDISTLSISHTTDNPFNKDMHPWERITMTRSSSFSSGISSLRTSPLTWRSAQNQRGSPESNWVKSSRTPPTTSHQDWTKNLSKETTMRRPKGTWSPPPSYDYGLPDWETKKSPWPAQIYPYPIAYTWSDVSPPWDHRSLNSLSVQSTPTKLVANTESRTDTVFSSLPTVILAATNACLVYYILNTKT